ncbi:hypothetical protein [Methanolapillus millepedarum]|uniref:Uncharacterized protein n=1 Tax=Methanolapillus millepedarum TaxID=3028296 RepID=A0AA96V1M8_9EURY|nr:hypothetical protein MsAc7_03290 [Methanosarcinaceae archaeon Ac7]
MSEVTGKIKTSTNGLVESFAMAGTKILSEALLKPLVGDATLKSGAIKLGIGIAANYLLPAGPFRRVVSSAEILDGCEDIYYGSGIGGMLQGFGGGGGGARGSSMVSGPQTGGLAVAVV